MKMMAGFVTSNDTPTTKKDDHVLSWIYESFKNNELKQICPIFVVVTHAKNRPQYINFASWNPQAHASNMSH
jgi:hypothetical protein